MLGVIEPLARCGFEVVDPHIAQFVVDKIGIESKAVDDQAVDQRFDLLLVSNSVWLSYGGILRWWGETPPSAHNEAASAICRLLQTRKKCMPVLTTIGGGDRPAA